LSLSCCSVLRCHPVCEANPITKSAVHASTRVPHLRASVFRARVRSGGGRPDTAHKKRIELSATLKSMMGEL